MVPQNNHLFISSRSCKSAVWASLSKSLSMLAELISLGAHSRVCCCQLPGWLGYLTSASCDHSSPPRRAHLHDGPGVPSTAKEGKPQHTALFKFLLAVYLILTKANHTLLLRVSVGGDCPRTWIEKGRIWRIWPFLLSPTDGQEPWQP